MDNCNPLSICVNDVNSSIQRLFDTSLLKIPPKSKAKLGGNKFIKTKKKKTKNKKKSKRKSR